MTAMWAHTNSESLVIIEFSAEEGLYEHNFTLLAKFLSFPARRLQSGLSNVVTREGRVPFWI